MRALKQMTHQQHQGTKGTRPKTYVHVRTHEKEDSEYIALRAGSTLKSVPKYISNCECGHVALPTDQNPPASAAGSSPGAPHALREARGTPPQGTRSVSPAAAEGSR